jgi:hypothetical protein
MVTGLSNAGGLLKLLGVSCESLKCEADDK